MLSRINFKGMIIIAVVLVVIQYTVGIIVSPFVKNIAVETLNRSGAMKIQLKELNFWPVTLSATVKGLKVFDPDGEDRIINVDSADCRLSLFGLLARRIIFNKIVLSGVDINIEGEPDGSFNIEKLAGPEKEDKEARGIFDRFKDQDWFSRIYRMIKKRHSKQGLEEEKKEIKAAKKIEKEITELPKGRRVRFKTISDDHILVVKSLVIKNGKIDVGENNRKLLEINKVLIKLSDLALDPKQGMDMGSLEFRGQLLKETKYSGRIDLEYKKYYRKNDIIADISLHAKDIDLEAVSFFYKDSLPVGVNSGILNVTSDTELINENINSKNSVILRDHDLTPLRGGPKTVLGFIPIQTLCEALNQTTPLKLDFDATGTVASPKITGFEKTLRSIVQPFMENMIKDEGVGAVKGFLQDKLGIKQTVPTEPATDDGSNTEKALDAVRSLFKKE